jgi:hypothetical protein
LNCGCNITIKIKIGRSIGNTSSQITHISAIQKIGEVFYVEPVNVLGPLKSEGEACQNVKLGKVKE